MTYERGVVQWKLAKSVKPTSEHFKDYKKTRSRYKRLKIEKIECESGILIDLFSECLQEKVHLAEPVVGAKEKTQMPEGLPSAQYLKNRFNKEYKHEFDASYYRKRYGIVKDKNENLANFDNIQQATEIGESGEIIRPSPSQMLEVELNQKPSTGFYGTLRRKRNKPKTDNLRQTLTDKNLGGFSLKVAIPALMIDSEFRDENITILRNKCKIYRVRSDNHCLFRAVSFSLAHGRTTVQQEARAIYTLREDAAQYLLNNAEEPFMSDGTSIKQEMMKLSKLKAEEVGTVNAVCSYYRSMLYRKKAGTLELWALSRALKRKITVFEKVIQDERLKKFANYFKHNASYGVSYGDELFLYKNGKGDYASLLMEAPEPYEIGDVNSVLNLDPTEKKSKKSLDVESEVDNPLDDEYMQELNQYFHSQTNQELAQNIDQVQQQEEETEQVTEQVEEQESSGKDSSAEDPEHETDSFPPVPVPRPNSDILNKKSVNTEIDF